MTVGIICYTPLFYIEVNNSIAFLFSHKICMRDQYSCMDHLFTIDGMDKINVHASLSECNVITLHVMLLYTIISITCI